MVKYKLNYRDYSNNSWSVEIDIPDYSGSVIGIRGAQNRSCIIQYPKTDNPFEPIVNSSANINVINEGQIDVEELQLLHDKQAKVSVYKEDNLEWIGFIIPDGIRRTISGASSEINIQATDGLSLLDGIRFSTANALPPSDVVLLRTPLQFISDILYRPQNLGLQIPIKWSSNIVNDLNGEDLLTGVQWATTGDGFNDGNGNGKSCDYILRGMIKSIGARIYQSGGEWRIDRIHTLNQELVPFRGRVITTDPTFYGSENRTVTIGEGGYTPIRDSVYVSKSPALKRVFVKYNQDQFDNILPNGGQDKVAIGLGLPYDWGITNKQSYQYISSEDTINNRDGYSTLITNQPPAHLLKEAPLTFGMIRLDGVAGYLPIDAFSLYNEINFGFTYMIQDSLLEDGAISDVEYDISSVAGQDTGTTFPLRFRVQMRVMTSGGSIPIHYALNQFGNWVEQGIFPKVEDTTISANSQNLKIKIGDVVTATGTRGYIKIPRPPVEVNPTDTCDIRVEFQVFGSTQVRIDDVFLNVNTNSEVYESERVGVSFTGSEEYDMNISSSYNGFYVSNYMTNWDRSDSEYYFRDGDNIGSLTYIDSRAKLRLRGKPNDIVDISIMSPDFKFAHTYEIDTFDGKKFIPLGVDYNTEVCSVDMTLYEIHNEVFSDIFTRLIASQQASSNSGSLIR